MDITDMTINHSIMWIYIGIACASALFAATVGYYAWEITEKYNRLRKILRRYQREEADRISEEWGVLPRGYR